MQDPLDRFEELAFQVRSQLATGKVEELGLLLWEQMEILKSLPTQPDLDRSKVQRCWRENRALLKMLRAALGDLALRRNSLSRGARA